MTPEHTYLDARINRAYVRMQKAKDSKWYDRWAEAFIASNSARNAIANVQKVRFPARDRESGAGIADRGSRSVPDLGAQSTTTLVVAPNQVHGVCTCPLCCPHKWAINGVMR